MKDRFSVARIRFHTDQGKGSRAQGQSLTEFALVMPLLIALLVAILLFAWIGFSYLSITSAARQGARHIMTYNATDAEVVSVVEEAMPFLNPDQAHITVMPQFSERVPITPVTVTVAYTVDLPMIRIPYFVSPGEFTLLGPIVLNAESVMELFE